jgi:hypothetical protein
LAGEPAIDHPGKSLAVRQSLPANGQAGAGSYSPKAWAAGSQSQSIFRQLPSDGLDILKPNPGNLDALPGGKAHLAPPMLFDDVGDPAKPQCRDRASDQLEPDGEKVVLPLHDYAAGFQRGEVNACCRISSNHFVPSLEMTVGRVE